ncbi:hypothetical protein ACEK07_04340 [Alcanivoracaceae bacterium MT1]
MKTLRIVAQDEGALRAALLDAGAAGPDAETGEFAPRWDEETQVVVIGSLMKPTGNVLTDEDGNEYPESAVVPGFHANILTTDEDLIAALASITVDPVTPLVEWAGIE